MSVALHNLQHLGLYTELPKPEEIGDYSDYLNLQEDEKETETKDSGFKL